MPLFVWIAFAIAMLLISGTVVAKQIPAVIAPITKTVNGPVGYIIVIGMIVIIAIAIWNKTRNPNKDDRQ